MQVRTGTSGEHAVLTVEGELDISTIAALQEAIVATAGPTGLIIDLGGVSFLDSSALRVLFSREGPARVLVAPPGSAARRLVELLSLLDAVPLVTEMSEATSRLDVGQR
jgi:anti-anti-sigma factor